jgi:LmbE family N-acetylglucosaminyl deacetylase
VKLRRLAARAAAAGLAVAGPALAGLTAVGFAPLRPVAAQGQDAAALDERLRALGMPVRVLMIAAHPDDEDTQLLTWLARARGATTAYLSLTRGDGGQNLIGNELGEALGAIRTEELLAARRIDGATQYFTRAFDFGFSKTAEETYRHWPKDTILGDVVRVVRSFAPHVIVAVFSGTPRDGHGHHQVSGLLAREAYDLAADTLRFPRRTHGAPWTVSKFYRSARFRSGDATLSFDVGTYNVLRGRGYAELAGESRSQHKSQGFGVLQRRGAVLDYVTREATRVNAATDPKAERDLFDGLDTLSVAFAGVASPDSVRRTLDRLRQTVDLRDPWPAVQRAVGVARVGGDHLLVAQASGLALEATVAAPVVAVGDTMAIALTLYNRGRVPVRWLPGDDLTPVVEIAVPAARDTITVAPGGSATRTIRRALQAPSTPWWRAGGRIGDWWATPITVASAAPDMGHVMDDEWRAGLSVSSLVELPGTAGRWPVSTPLVHRFADPVKGDQQRAVLAAPRIGVRLERAAAYVPAGRDLARAVRVLVRSVARDTQLVRVALEVPRGLRATSASPVVRVAPGTETAVTFQVTGRLPAGRHRLSAVATTGAAPDTTTWRVGYERIDYDHIRPLHLLRDATLELTSVEVMLPARTAIAYVPGVGDNVRPMLEDLGFQVTTLDAAAVATADLSRFRSVVVGPRAFEANEAVFAQRERLYAYARNGGTLVLQYGQYELTTPGALPYPVTIARPHDRVTEEDAAVRVLAPGHPLLAVPNRITDADWQGWVQERGLYMPRTIDRAYTPLVSTNDTGEPARDHGLLVAPLGRGVFVYTSLAFFRQLPAGVPGAARLFVNLLSATPAGAGGRVP